MLHTNETWVLETPFDQIMTVVWSHHFFFLPVISHFVTHTLKHIIYLLWFYNWLQCHSHKVGVIRTGVGEIYYVREERIINVFRLKMREWSSFFFLFSSFSFFFFIICYSRLIWARNCKTDSPFDASYASQLLWVSPHSGSLTAVPQFPLNPVSLWHFAGLTLLQLKFLRDLQSWDQFITGCIYSTCILSISLCNFG